MLFAAWNKTNTTITKQTNKCKQIKTKYAISNLYTKIPKLFSNKYDIVFDSPNTVIFVIMTV